MKKIRVGVLFGGKSAEHEISLLSAKNIIEAMDKNKYEPVLIGIDKNGEWHRKDVYKYLVHPENPKLVHLDKTKEQVALIPKENTQTLVGLNSRTINEPLDIIFPVLHGTYGEDGTVQGLLKLANIPFVGAGVLGSAVGMDKDVMKRLLRDAGMPIAKFLSVTRSTCPDFAFIKKELGLPFFVKPANLGSSVGVSKVKTEEDFEKAMEDAFQYDHKVMIEEFIQGREIECALLGNENPMASRPGEVIPKDEFYSYDAKYIEDSGTCFITPVELPEETIQSLHELCIKAFEVLCCKGMARVDCFLKPNGEVIINEINTIPGFTSTSMYPKLWQASGMALPELVDRLIQLGLESHKKESSLKTSF